MVRDYIRKDEVHMVQSELRPCLVKGKKYLFHRWADRRWVVGPSSLRGGHPGGECAEVFAIVEDEEGQVLEFYPSQIKFLDRSPEESKEASFEPCKCYHLEYGYGVCWGTREKDPCSCGGDKSICDHYPESRK